MPEPAGRALERGTTDFLERDLDSFFGGAGAKKVEKSLGIKTAGGLLFHFPRRYVRRGDPLDFRLLPLGEHVTLVGKVTSVSTRKMQSRRGILTEVEFTDDADQGHLMRATFFNARHVQRELRIGYRALFAGKVGSYRNELNLAHPDYELLADDDDAGELARRPIPIYPGAVALPSWRIRNGMATLLSSLAFERLDDVVPHDLRMRHGLPDIRDALEKIHTPGSLEEAYLARKRFKYEEALVLQTVMARRRAENDAAPAVSRAAREGGLLSAFDAALPFELTAGQRVVGLEVAGDLARSRPMHRLLQGDVGTGKTLVALRAMLQVVDAGGQAALLAPTEVLAQQHEASIRSLLGALGNAGELGADESATRVVLVTGNMTAARRRRALLDVASGEAGIVVGTHALLSENVGFCDLGLVVVDEQHRFGVEQRDALRTRGTDSIPHLLVMTATPIPRTVAMTVFGDLEVSELTEAPAGRARIATHLVALSEHPQWERRIWARVREEVDAGRQVFVVCPRIDDGDTVGAEESAAGAYPHLSSIESLERRLAAEPALDGVGLGVLHGRIDQGTRSETMNAFAAGKLGVLLATTVIEVGVDVPNATLMVILSADRFGVAQLHQLRGRVGRSDLASTCLLVTDLEANHPSLERLRAVASTTDGHELARLDLMQRREGDVLGGQQSGVRSTLRILRVIEDAKLIEQARRDASDIVRVDPDLRTHEGLRAAVLGRLDDNTEAFLKRG